MKHFTLIGAIVALLLVAPACGIVPQSPQQAAERIAQLESVAAQADTVIADAQRHKDELVQLVMVLPQGMADSLAGDIERLDQLIDETVQYREQALETIREIEQATAGASEWHQIVGGVGGAIIPFIPPPWNAVAGGVLAVAIALMGHKKGKQKGDANAVQIAASIEAARRENTLLDQAMHESKATLARFQTDEQHALVNRAQHKL